MMTRTYTHDELVKATEDAVGLFIEYRDVYGYSEENAKLQALAEVAESTSPATYADIEDMHDWQQRADKAAADSVVEESDLDREYRVYRIRGGELTRAAWERLWKYREYRAMGGELTRAAWERLWKLHFQYIESDRRSPYEEVLRL